MSSLLYLFCCVAIFTPHVSFRIPVEFTESQPNSGKVCGDMKKVCTCGTGPAYVSFISKMCSSFDPNTKISTCQPCDGFQDVCEKYKHCAVCSTESCTSCPQGKTGKFCNKSAESHELIPDAVLNSSLPIRFTISRGDLNNHRRVLRAKTGCDLPPLETAELNCVKYDYKVSCEQVCIWGYKLSNENSKYECTYRQKYWTPYKMEECKKYVDCDVELVSRGRLSCTNYRVGVPDECSISCVAYDESYDNAGYVPEENHVCDENGEYSPPLPYCAVMNRTTFFEDDFI